MVTESYFFCHTRTWSTHHFSWQDTWAIFRLWGGSLFLKLWQHFPLKKKRTWNHSHIQYPLGIRRLKSAWSLLIRTERSGVPNWRCFSRLKNMAIHLEPSFQVKFPIQSWETVLMYWFITVSVRLRTRALLFLSTAVYFVRIWIHNLFSFACSYVVKCSYALASPALLCLQSFPRVSTTFKPKFKLWKF